MAQGRVRRKGALSWTLATLGGIAVVLVFVAFRAWRRPESASRETTLSRAELARDSGKEVPGGAGPACAGHAACAQGALCTRERCRPITAATTECRSVTVRFPRTNDELTASADAAVERLARCIAAGREPAVGIEPSRDPAKGTEANELHTKARVSAVRRALEQRGIAAERWNPAGLDAGIEPEQ